eukprot:365908-Chlamydomonas_euryale.AAC.3
MQIVHKSARLAAEEQRNKTIAWGWIKQPDKMIAWGWNKQRNKMIAWGWIKTPCEEEPDVIMVDAEARDDGNGSCSNGVDVNEHGDSTGSSDDDQ